MRSTRLWATVKERRSLPVPLLAAGAIGLAYYLLVRLTGFSLACPVQTLTGLACPGCGITHLFTRLFGGDFAAFEENWGITAAAVLWFGAAGTVALRRRQIRGITREKPVQAVTWVCIGLLLVFALLRNLPGFAFLLPTYMR